MSKSSQNQDKNQDDEQSQEPNQLNQEVADPAKQNDPDRVANNGEVHDPGNSGLVGTDGVVDGQADKPNG